MAKGKFVSSMIDLAEKAGLDMSEAARMARARESGFDTSQAFYHGNESGIIENDSFDLSRAGENFPVSWSDAIYLGDEKLASHYGEVSGKYVVKNPLKINAKEVMYEDYLNAKTGQDFDEWAQSVEDGFGIYGFMEQGFSHFMDAAKKQGNDSIVIDFSGLPVKEKRVAFTQNPSAIRHVDAAFDPAKKDSSNLLAGAATVGGIGAGAALTAAPQNSYADSLHDVVMKAKPSTREIMDAQRKREDYLKQIEMLNHDDNAIQAPQSNAALSVASGMDKYNKERKKRLNPVLDFVLPAGELPVEYMTKIGYGDEITFKDRLNAVLGML